MIEPNMFLVPEDEEMHLPPEWLRIKDVITGGKRPMTYDRLVEWCGRYPEYAKRLSKLFVEHAVDCLREGELQHLLVLTDEERFAEVWDYPDADLHAAEVLRQQGRPLPPVFSRGTRH